MCDFIEFMAFQSNVGITFSGAVENLPVIDDFILHDCRYLDNSKDALINRTILARGHPCWVYFSAISWLFWNNLIEQYAVHRYRIEDELPDLLIDVCMLLNKVEFNDIPPICKTMYGDVSELNKKMKIAKVIGDILKTSKVHMNSCRVPRRVHSVSDYFQHFVQFISFSKIPNYRVIKPSDSHARHIRLADMNIIREIDPQLVSAIEEKALLYGYTSDCFA